MSPPEYPMNDDRPRAGALAYLPLAAGVLIGLAALAGLIATPVLLVRRGEAITGRDLPALAVLLVTALAGGVLVAAVIGARRLMGRLLDQVGSLEQRTAILAEQMAARNRPEPPPAPPTMDPTELRGLLAEIRDILLLPQDQRIRRYQAIVDAEFQRRLAAAERFVASRDFHRARDELAALADRFGNDDRVREARNRLELAADAARANDITQAANQIQDLIGLARWDDAELLARELSEKYPAAPEPAVLADRISRERKLFDQRQRQRLFEEIQQLVHQRRWREAADGTRRFLTLFPKDIEAGPLRTQLTTLDANAEIQTRQHLEQQYKEFAQQQRYWDALDLARRIIAEFPFSPQANALRGQMPRLEELARQHEPQRE